MKISELLDENLIELNLKGEVKEEVLAEMVELLKEEDKITDKDKFYQTILEREQEGTTGLGRGVAIPHGKSEVVNDLALVFGRSQAGIDFNSRDGQPVHLFFMVADYEGHSPEYLEMVAQLTKNVRQDDYREELLTAESEEEIIAVTKNYE
ncbi:PTS sugar transporter subunit IIA [Halanaerobacter jeridensis]|uniref:Fructose-specific phosphotransferase system IIA component n=1 Tax=Halanaerobacter jeridensis TaxID=706427 RepID=A0A939BMV6_9FIRM|nr:PTS sugar transporter subunit IIA [Halanaerobacter jeridensis]MBM7557600.1 fructose-specific phosphotransferase system IIA component [Halanaerobacter jeridensis]